MTSPGDPGSSRRRLHRIQAVTTQISQARSREAAAEVALDGAIEVLEADGGLVALATEDGTHIRFVHSKGYPPEEDEALEEAPIPIERATPTVQAVATGRPFFAADAAEVVSRYPAFAGKVGRTGFQAAAYIPMRGVNRVLGAFHVVYRRPRTFTDEDVSLLTSIADQCAVAMEREIHVEALRRREAELKRTTGLLRALAETTTDLIYVKDRDGTFLFVNEPTAHALGSSIDEVVGSDERSFLPRDEAETIRTNDREVLRTGVPQVFEEAVTTPEGRVVYLSTKDPLIDEQGQVGGVVGVSQDITHRKAMELALRAERDRRIALLASLQDGFFVVDADLRLLEVGDRFCEIVGFERSQLVGSVPPYPFVPTAGRGEDLVDPAVASVFGHEGGEFDIRFVRGDGRLIDVMVTASGLRDPSGETTGFVGTIKDVTERRRAQARLERMQRLSEGLALSRTTEDVARALLDQLDHLVAARAAAVWVVEGRAERARVVAVDGLTEEEALAWGSFALEPGRPVSDAVLDDRLVTLDSPEEIRRRYGEDAAVRFASLGIASIVVVPLSIAGRRLGALILSFADVGALDPEETAVTIALARQAAQSLERVRNDEAEAAARDRVERLQDVTEALGSALRSREVCEVAGKATRGATGADAVAVLLRQRGSDALHVRHAHGYTKAELRDLTRSLPAASLSTLREGRPLWLDTAEDVRTHHPRAVGLSTPFVAEALLPLTQGSDLAGVLIVGFRQERTVPEPERELLVAIARQTSQALERAALYAEQAASRRQAEHRAGRSARLQAFTAALSGVSTLDQVLQVATERSIEVVGATDACLLMLDELGETLRTMATAGRGMCPGPPVPMIPVAAELGAARAFREGTALWFRSLEDYRAGYPAADLEGAEPGAVAMLPLVLGGRPAGALTLRFDDERAVAEPERWVVSALVEQIAQALERAQLFDSAERARALTERERVRLERLQRASAGLARAGSAEEAAHALLVSATEAARADGGAVLLPDDDGMLRAISAIGDVGPRAEPPDGGTPADEALAEGEMRWRDPAQGDASGTLAVPLRAAGRTVGVLELRFSAGGEPDPQDRDIVSTLASQAAVALSRAMTYELEHEVASTLQRAMLPASLPQPVGLRVQGRYLAATDHLDVGGDWYDAIELPDGRLAVVVGDVVGRGLPAATAMGQLRTAWRALTLNGMEPAETLAGLDAFARSTIGAECTTVAGAVIDVARRRIRYACAGHLPPLILGAGGATRFLNEGRMPPLAVTDAEPLIEGTEVLEPGDTLIMYTDGLVERRDESLDEGLERLALVASSLGDRPLEGFSDDLIDRLTPDPGLADDAALLVVRERPEIRHSDVALPEQLASMRADMRRWLAGEAIPFEVGEDVVLAAGEAASNALEHAYRDRERPGTIAWSLTREPDRGVIVSIQDQGTWRPGIAETDRGNGLRLMRSVMDDVAIDTGPGGTTITMSRRIDGRDPAA